MIYYFYHCLSALVISIILLITMAIMDVLVQSTHLTLLLINIDFLIDPSKTPLLLELAIHIFIGWLIYFIFLLIYHVFKPLYKLSYVLLMIVLPLFIRHSSLWQSVHSFTLTDRIRFMDDCSYYFYDFNGLFHFIFF